jgi:hypothetical protein
MILSSKSDVQKSVDAGIATGVDISTNQVEAESHIRVRQRGQFERQLPASSELDHSVPPAGCGANKRPMVHRIVKNPFFFVASCARRRGSWLAATGLRHARSFTARARARWLCLTAGSPLRKATAAHGYTAVA